VLRPLSRLLGAVLALAVVALGMLPAQGPGRDQEIAELEKQLAELHKKLEALKKSGPPTPSSSQALPPEWVKALTWRCVGPASMGGRIVALAVAESDPITFWAGTASAGLLKTSNNGITFDHQLDREGSASIGDVAVAPSNKEIVWAGTGEHNPRNSVSYGDGVYKSTDGGKSWTNMGLKKSFQIGRIVIHPTNPDIVYVGALGRLYGPSEERGLYKTTDGGKTWKKILHVDDNTGVIEAKMSPGNPDELLVATWERRRDGFDTHAGALANAFNPDAKLSPPLEEGYDAYDPVRKWGKGSGLYRTTDGGMTWKKVTKGLPTGQLGRIGLDYYRKNPKVVFAIVDGDRIGMGRVPGYLGVTMANEKGLVLKGVEEGSPAEKAGLKAGDRITSAGGKPVKDMATMTAALSGTKPGDKLTVEVERDGKPLKIEVTLGERFVGGGMRRIDFKGEDVKEGVRIASMIPNGPASRAGLAVGDIVTTADGKPVKSMKELTDLVRSKGAEVKIPLSFLRAKEKKEGVYAFAPRRPVLRPYASLLGGQRENVQAQQGPDGHEYGGVYRSDDGGESWTRVNSLNPRPMYFSQVRVDPSDDKRVYVLGIRLHVSEDGGKTFTATGSRVVHDDAHALWIDPRDGRHMILGTDGGTYVTYDRGAKWDFLSTTAIGQFYHVCVDNKKPYTIYGGMQDNGSWGGPSRALDGKGPINADWRFIAGGDGFVCRVAPDDDDIVYTESQDGNISYRNLRTGEGRGIRPQPKAGEGPFRFNWNTPFIVSSHDPRTVYIGGNHVFRSQTRGTNARPISPELCKSHQASASAVAESPRKADILWAGTDDGQLWVTRDGGGKWDNVTAKVGLPKPFWVATIDPSRFADGRCYVCFDAHRSDDDNPHVYVTEDFGQTWKPIRGNLPSGSSRCLREDLANPDVLYLGTELAVWASIDRGASWTKINNNLPTVAVHELAQHPTAGEMVAGTHGRSIWILDVTPIRSMKRDVAQKAASLFTPAPAVRWRQEPPRRTAYGNGNREFFGENPAPGAHVYYALTKKAGKASLVVQDVAGKVIATLPVANAPGLHRATWNLQASPTASLAPFDPRRLLGGAVAAPAGSYRVVLTVDGVEMVQVLKVENDPTRPTRDLVTEPEGEASGGP
jgi:photosystem II stability/assembly factor-like uncharacterized protein